MPLVPAEGMSIPRRRNDTMPLTHTRDLFAKALKGKYALGAFNVNNIKDMKELRIRYEYVGGSMSLVLMSPQECTHYLEECIKSPELTENELLKGLRGWADLCGRLQSQVLEWHPL